MSINYKIKIMKKTIVIVFLFLFFLSPLANAQNNNSQEELILKNLVEAQQKINEQLDGMNENLEESKKSQSEFEKKTENNIIKFEADERRALEEELNSLRKDFNDYKLFQIEKVESKKNQFDLNMYHALLLAFIAMTGLVYFYIGKTHKEVKENAEELASQEISRITKIYRNNIDDLNDRMDEFEDMLLKKSKLWTDEINDIEEKIKNQGTEIVNNREISQYFVEGLILNKHGKYEEALKLWDKIIIIDPENCIAYSNRSASLIYLGQYKEALDSARKAIEINNFCGGAWYNKACAYSRLNNNKKAVENLSKAIELDKKFKSKAEKEKDFDNIRNFQEYRELMLKY